MDISNILQTFITPPIPYFFLGLLAAFAKSDLAKVDKGEVT